ncbi:MAG: GNVR domain-containing protein [Rhodobacterales bacterium]|nr:GNVR domain-containing protein [Rhodobacterales bacterium]
MTREPRQTQPPRATESGGIELSAIFGSLRRSKWLILGCILFVTVATYAALQNVRPSYDAYVEVLLNTRQERVVGVEQVISDLNVTNSVVAGEIAVLRSNLLLGQVVDDLDLMQHPDFNPFKINEPGRLGRWIDSLRALILGTPKAPDEPMPEVERDEKGGLSAEAARNLVIWQLRRNLSVYQSGISYVISLSMRAHDPEIGAAIANAVAEQYISDQLHTKQAATQRAIAWLDNRLVELERQLRDAEDAVVEFLARQVLDEGGDKNSIDQQLAEMNRSIVIARDERAAAEARLDYVRRLMAEDGPEGAAAALDTPRLTSLDTELATLTRQRAQLATRLGPQHPQMLAFGLALGDLTRDRIAAIRAGIAELEAVAEQARGREEAIKRDIIAAQMQKVELSRSSVRLSQMERSASAMRQVYENFLAGFQETTQQLEFQRADARIITAAQPALAPSWPRVKLIMIVALTLGAILGVAAALVREALDRSVRNAAELTRMTGLAVLSVLPKVRIRDRGTNWQLARLQQPKVSAYGEGLRLLRFGLMNTAVGTPPRIVLMTGADWRVGCSTATLGLGRAMTAVGLRVVLLDANFRRPAQADLLGLTPQLPGVAEYLSGTASLDEIIITDVEPGLSVIPASPGETSPADLIATPQFGELPERLAQIYDVVLIDAPPATGLADTTILTGLADATLLIVRSHRTRAASVMAVLDALEGAGGNVVGLVLSHGVGGSGARGGARAPARAVGGEGHVHV